MIARPVVALAFAATVASMAHFGTVAGAAAPSGTSALDAMNVQLAARGAHYRIAKMEYVTRPGSGQLGATVFAKDVGNKQLDLHFVSGLLLYASSAPGVVSFAIDTHESVANGGLTGAQTAAAISSAMSTWGNQSCSTLQVGQVGVPRGTDLGIVQNLLGYGGADIWVADITHAGWLPGSFFDQVASGGQSFIIGVTFTLIWVDGDGNPVDTNHDGKYDAAFREIYYNNAFTWTTNVVDWTSADIDVETIALHEGGHGFSQAHFGQILFDGSGFHDLNHLHFAPRAVMNAIYWDSQRSLLGSDTAGHCSIWATWHM